MLTKLYPKHSGGGKHPDILPGPCPWAKTGVLAQPVGLTMFGLTMFAEEPMHIFMRLLLLTLLLMLLMMLLLLMLLLLLLIWLKVVMVMFMFADAYC